MGHSFWIHKRWLAFWLLLICTSKREKVKVPLCFFHQNRCQTEILSPFFTSCIVYVIFYSFLSAFFYSFPTSVDFICVYFVFPGHFQRILCQIENIFSLSSFVIMVKKCFVMLLSFVLKSLSPFMMGKESLIKPLSVLTLWESYVEKLNGVKISHIST